MNLKLAIALALLSIPVLPTEAHAADDLIFPPGRGVVYLQDNASHLWPAMVVYTTDDNGNAIPIGSSAAVLGAVTQGALSSGAEPWQVDLYNVRGSAMGVTNPVSCRISNGTAYVDPTQIRALASGTDSVTVPGMATASNQTTGNTSLASILSALGGFLKTELYDSLGNGIGSQTVGGANYINATLAASGTSGGSAPARTLQIGGGNGTSFTTWLVDALGIGQVSLGNTNRTPYLLNGVLVTTATTANQVIVSHTVTSGKTFYLQGFDVVARATTLSVADAYFGNAYVSINGSNTLGWELQAAGPASIPQHDLAEPVPVSAGEVVSLVVTPNAVTSYTWTGNMIGYEK